MRADLEIRRRDRAREAVYRAVKSGTLVPATDLSCLSCGQPAQEYDHYKGYERTVWLDVEPVCIPCHRARASSRVRYHETIRFEGSSAEDVIGKFRTWAAEHRTGGG